MILKTNILELQTNIGDTLMDRSSALRDQITMLKGTIADVPGSSTGNLSVPLLAERNN